MLDTKRLRAALRSYENARSAGIVDAEVDQIRVSIADYGDIQVSEEIRKMICEEMAVRVAARVSPIEQEIIEACKELSNAR